MHITIDSKRTVQLDYAGMHFAIMYAELGMDTPMADPYALSGRHLRGDIKTAFNILINCSSRAEAIGTIDQRIREGALSKELISGEHLLEAFAETHPLIKDRIATGEGVKGQYTDSRIAERLLLKGIDLGLCILPIHDGFITTSGDALLLERLMNEAFREITGHTPGVKPEAYDLSVLTGAGDSKPYWITRPDGTVERDGPLEGKAVSYSRVLSGTALWGLLEEGTKNKRNRNRREQEWKFVHGHTNNEAGITS